MKKLFFFLLLGMVWVAPLFGYLNEVYLGIGFSPNPTPGENVEFSREFSSDGGFTLSQYKGDFYGFTVRCYNASQKQKAKTDLKELINALIQAGHADCLDVLDPKASGANKYLSYDSRKISDFSGYVDVGIFIKPDKISY